MDLYVVQSPFQLISAIESYAFFKTSAILIIKYSGSTINNTQLLLLKDMVKHDFIIEVNLLNSNFLSNIALLYNLKKIIGRDYDFVRLFIGDYRSFHMRKFFDCLKSKNRFLLDDGAVMYDINNNLLRHELDDFNFIGFKGAIKKILYSIQSRLLNLGYKPQREIDLFTCYELVEYRENKVVNHNFDYFCSFAMGTKISTSTVYFYGSNIHYLGFSEEDELSYFSKVFNHYDKLNINLIYVPHRNEKEYKLKKIGNKFDIEIKKCIYPAEIDFILSKEAPQHVASFFSSVLITLPLIRDFDSVTSFFPPIKKMKNLTLRREFEIHRIEYINKMSVIDID